MIKQAKYKASKQAKQYTFDLYLADADELTLSQLLDDAKAKKQLKAVIKEALLLWQKNKTAN
ncbi:hypothetical protein [Moraxella pluranimalium]|uniref:Uncharacterized protein n=1 Tax=Moraxella pluranimalium TaxID=470453 RepID=A0A1T0CPE3_9GAMM|nr:hypothetical protein [Moraxella pluranimalium]OOS24217.1 hypothetical protein B0680_05410 [Moraxella pluranimalium]